MKKIFSAIIASVMAVSGLSAVTSSAVNMESANSLSVSTSVVESDVITENGDVVPAGAIAVTVNIDGNSGFNHSATKLELGLEANVVVDEMGRPVFTKGDVLNDSIATSAVKNGTVVISSASSSETFEDGEMFTFYVSDNYSGVSISDISNMSVCTNNDLAQTENERYVFTIGNVDGDNYIDACDATDILVALRIYREAYPNTPFSVAFANNHLSTYFPHSVRAEVADTDKTTYITNTDANNVLQFYSYVSTGYTVEEAYDELSLLYDNYCGELVILCGDAI